MDNATGVLSMLLQNYSNMNVKTVTSCLRYRKKHSIKYHHLFLCSAFTAEVLFNISTCFFFPHFLNLPRVSP